MHLHFLWVVLRGQLENPAPGLQSALRAFHNLELTPVTGELIELRPKTPLPQLRLTEGQIEELVVAFTAGASVRELATHYGTSRQTIAKHLKAQGLQTVHSMNQSEIERAIDLYIQGWSLVRVGEALGFDHGTVHNVLRRAGVRMRDPQGRERS